jgi:hypothetical protein
MLAIIGSMHFAFSLTTWALYLFAFYRHDTLNIFCRQMLGALPTLLMLTCYLASFLLAWKRRRRAAVLLVAGLLLSLACFAYDASARNWQFHMENYSAPQGSHQKTFFYCTWWWYDESWFYH